MNAHATSADFSRDFQAPYPLHPLDSGRLFYRQLTDNQSAIVGVVEVPRVLRTEHFTLARLNARFWLDARHQASFGSRTHHPEDMPTCDVTSLLRNLQFRGTAMPDAFEVGVRATPMAQSSPDTQWAIVFAGLNHRLRACPRDGLYELGAAGPKLVDDNPHTGKAIGTVLREPVWGPRGDQGLLMSLEPAAYAGWVEGERQRNAQRDPRYGEFLDAMKGLQPLPLVYTRAEMRDHEAAAAKVVRSIMAKDRIDGMANLAKDLGVRPR